MPTTPFGAAHTLTKQDVRLSSFYLPLTYASLMIANHIPTFTPLPSTPPPSTFPSAPPPSSKISAGLSPQIPTAVTTFPPPLTQWSFRKADWSTFQTLCSTLIHSPDILQSDDPIQQFSTSLIRIANLSIPKSQPSAKIIPKPWFNSDCKNSIKTRQRALHQAKTHPTSDNISKYRIARAQTRRTIRTLKRQTWTNYVSNLNPRTPTRKVWQMIRKISGKPCPSPRSHLKANDSCISNETDIANVLGKTFAHNSSSSNYSPKFQHFKSTAETSPIDFSSNNDEPYNLPISMAELNSSIHQSRNTAMGPDLIHYQLIRHLPETCLELLLTIFNHIWLTDSFPHSWHQATILPIPKPGKDPTNPQNYRPIALTSCLCKTLERILNNRLIWFLETNKILSAYQSGFRKNRSTNDHLIRLETYIRNAFLAKEHVLGMFFDMEKAYDSAWKYGASQDMLLAGLRGHLPIFISNFLSDREFRVRYGSTYSNLFPQELGFPQGSILSVTLFGLRINSIVQNINPNIQCSLFVDDFAIYIRSCTVNEAESIIQKCINKVQAWCDCNGFKFSPSKSHCILFRRPHSRPSDPHLTLNGSPIPVSTEVKFLGILFDSKLTFSPHIIELKAKCLKTLNLLKVVAHSEWGGDPSTLLNLYRSLIRSKLDYGCIIYSSAKKTILQTLDTISNQALRLCLGAYRTSPSPSLHIEAREPPLHLRRTKLSLQFACKLAANLTNPTLPAIFPLSPIPILPKSRSIPPISTRLSPALHHLHISPADTIPLQIPPIPPWTLPTPSIILDPHLLSPKSTTSPTLLLHRYHELIHDYPHHTKIFTDGSKMGPVAAASAVTPTHCLQRRLPNGSSIFSAELAALNLAISYVIDNPNTNYIILSDSLSSLKAIQSQSFANPFILDLYNSLHSLPPNYHYLLLDSQPYRHPWQ